MASSEENKKNGVYYTPRELATYLARPLIKKPGLHVFDPAYGEGALLLAAERVYLEKKLGDSKIHLYGCDIKPLNGLLQHLPEAHLKKTDFFEYASERLYDVILTNPPYIRHHIQDNVKVDSYKANHSNLQILNNSADLWSYFLIKAVSHLKKGGSIGAILPWAFLQADYAVPLRKWFSEIFGDITMLTLSNRYFEEADERIVVLWCENFGVRSKTIKIGSSKDILEESKYFNLSLADWLSDRIFYANSTNVANILERYVNEYKFQRFETYANIKIGVVTGANKYFTLSHEKAEELGFERNKLIPVLTNARELVSYISTGNRNLKKLLKLDMEDYKTFSSYLKLGVTEGYNLRAHSTLRDPWYKVKIGKVPDAFFPYRINHTPHIVRNKYGTQCTNSIHRIYFKNLDEVEIQWLEISILSDIGQLSLEAYSKTYGRGFLKIEPKSLKNALVLKRRDKQAAATHEKIMKFLAEGNKALACETASEFISKKCNISSSLLLNTKRALDEFQNIRLL